MATKKTKDLKNQLSKMEESLLELQNQIEPLFDFDDLGKQIEILKKTTTKNLKKMPDNMGETCMHGNSWHSNCSECDELHTIDDIFLLVEEFPNDAELGAKVRELYNHYISDSDNTKE